jgi:hypothetical protein
MKTLSSLLCGAALFAAAVTSAESRPCAGTGFTLTCRGHLQIQNHGTGGKDITFTKSPHAAGSNGAPLAPGSCAWEDRPVHQNEPSHMTYVTQWNAANQGWFSLVSKCAFNDKCTVEVCVRTEAGNVLKVLSDHAIVRFPF